MSRKSISIFLFFLISGFASMHAESQEISSSLRHLDEIVASRNYYDQSAQAEIEKARQEYRQSQSPEEQYNALRSLFNLYRTYKVDSALIIADQRLEAATRLGQPSKIASATLNLADGYAKIGNADLSISLLDALNHDSLQPYQLKYLNSIYKTAYSNKASIAILPREKMEAMENLKKYREREWEEVDPHSRAYYTLQAERLREAGMVNEAVAMMQEAQRKFEIDDNPSILYELGATYLAAEMTDSALFYLSKAAALDLTNGSKEYKSLILLASVLYDRGDVDRAFAYINCAFEDATFSKALIRTEEIMKIMPGIYTAYAEKEREIRRRTMWFFIAIGVLNVILFILLGLLIKERRVKKRMIREIHSINSSLKVRNRELSESDKIKMEHLKHFMIAYSGHIARLKTFRKNISRLIHTSQYNKALEKIRQEKEDSPDGNAFQEMFDAAFLSMFPDFVEKLNGYFHTPIENLQPGRLTPELRIVALMKIGVTSTKEISEMFQYSAQSVYNLRSTLRGMIKVDWDEFEQAVLSL